MKTFFVRFLWTLNFFVLIGLLLLVGYQFKTNLDLTKEKDRLGAEIRVPIVSTPNTPNSTQGSSITTATLQINDDPNNPVKRPDISNEKGVEQKVNLFFSKDPDSKNDFTKVFPAQRTSNRIDIATYLLEQLIAGPTQAEKDLGFFTPLKLNGNSNCGVNDFTLNIENGKAKLKFCKSIISAGVGDDARIKSTIESTLKQFSSVQSTQILNNNGSCFGDLSGQDLCKN
jgi:Sporulation and spore germination